MLLSSKKSINMHKQSTHFIIIAIFIIPIVHKLYPSINNHFIMSCWPQYLWKIINMLSPHSAVPCNYPPTDTNEILCWHMSSQISVTIVPLPHIIDVSCLRNEILLCRRWYHIIWWGRHRLQQHEICNDGVHQLDNGSVVDGCTPITNRTRVGW